ncbi:MAG: hypothetical protein ABIJ60_02130 [Patescibacteria group bacterium]
MTKSFECPYCKKGFFYKKEEEIKKHIKDCPCQFTDSQKRFEQIIKLAKKKNLKRI